MQTAHPFDRLRAQFVEDLLMTRLAQAQTNPGSKKSAELESCTSASSLYRYLEGKQEELVTTQALCEFTGWNPEQVYDLVKTEGLPVHRVRKRGHLKFYLPEVGQWIKERDESSSGASAKLPDGKAT